MPKFNLTNKAVEDLNEIWEYTLNKWSETQADNYYKMIISSCQAIANNKNLGKNYKGITAELFGFKVNRHIIFYRNIENKPIEISRILHERMDLKNKVAE